MNKIIDVINNMIKNSERISNIERRESIYYFSYKGYLWAIWEWSSPNDEAGISLAYYPFCKNISEIKNQKDYIAYSSDEFDSGTAFNQLYYIIKEKFFGVDKAFEDILKD